ncbi:GLUG motif-containing protein [Fibrobacter sp. NR9]|nr:GLUG motif-containing protein [Fibrobacter sp. NR9]
MVEKIKSLSFCLLFFISASFAANWDGLSSEPKNTREIDGKVFYEISSSEELAWFAEQVNGGKTTINAVLVNDIKFMDATSKTSSKNWTPIGSDSTMRFNGIFDGAGRTIYGLRCNRTFAGMFGVTDKDAVIKNVKLAKSSIISGVLDEDGYVFIGGIVAINNGALYECAYSGTVFYANNGTSIARPSSMGGIVGINKGSVENCTNRGTITVSGLFSVIVGGIVGMNSSSYKGFGRWVFYTVKGCVNEGSVSVINGPYSDAIGGIVGDNSGSVENCTNSGMITGERRVGGIVGDNSGSVENCTNSGTITGEKGVGGIVGTGGSVENCTNSGTITGKNGVGGIVGSVGTGGSVKNCMNEAVISADSSVGGIVGAGVSVENCINSGTITGQYEVGGIVGYNRSGGTGVKNCMNAGPVSGPVSSTKANHVGGIAGWNSGTVSVCTNSGLVEGDKSAGIVGYNENMVTDCRSLVLTSKRRGKYAGLVYQNKKSSTPWVVATIRNSFSVANHAFGGIMDSFENEGTVANCYYDSAVYTNSIPLGREIPNAEMRTSDMQSDRFAWILNTTNGDSAHSGIWSRDSVGYPIFADSLHKPIYKVVFDNGRDSMDCFTNYKGLIPFPSDPDQPGKLFRGWFTDDGDKIDNLTIFSKDQTVHAAYTDLYFSIRFFDSDWSLLDSQYVKYGEFPVYGGPIPKKTSSGKYEYVFSGWSPTLKAVTGAVTYTAVFDSTRIIPQAVPVTVPFSPTRSVTASGRNFQIHAAPVGKSYALFDLQGKVLAKGRIESSEMTISAPRAGSYIIRVGNRSVRMNAR